MNEDKDLDEPLYRVVCAAIRHKNSCVLCGARHYDDVMRKMILKLICLACEADVSLREDGWYSCDQGFINNKGEFLTREQAWKVAEAAGQIRQITGTAGTLFSEDLY